jgi:hypothetical protein
MVKRLHLRRAWRSQSTARRATPNPSTSPPQIRALCRRVRLVRDPGAEHAGMTSTVMIALADGHHFEGCAENGMLEPGELEDKSRRLTRGALGEPGAAALYGRLQRLEDEADLGRLGVQP